MNISTSKHCIISALFKEHKLSYDSFLLNHSTAYHIALCVGLFEYLVTYVNLGPDYKFYAVIMCDINCVRYCVIDCVV